MEKIVQDHAETFLETALFVTAVSFAAFAASAWDIQKSLLHAVFLGLLAGLLAFLYIRAQEKDARAAYNEILEREQILCYIEAAVTEGRGSMKGRLFLTDKNVRFREFGIFGRKRSLCLPYTGIEAVSMAEGKRNIGILTANGGTLILTVHRKAEFAKQLEMEVKKARESTAACRQTAC